MSINKVDIIVVNWNSGNLITNLLKSFESISDTSVIEQLIVVDNASTDDSLKNIENGNWTVPIKIIKNEKNLGFAKACNIGANHSKQKYVLFLNPDTFLYDTSISKCVDFLDKDSEEKYGACGIQLVDNFNVPNRSCARIPNFKNFLISSFGLNTLWPERYPGILIREWKHNTTQDIGHVIGAFYMVRRSVFEKFGGFDERFFLYYEDLDFSTTLHNNNYKIAFLSDVRAVHIGGGCSQKIKARRLSYSYLSKILYINKHFPWYKSLPLVLIVLTLEPLMRFFFYFLQLSVDESMNSIKGYIQFLFSGFFKIFGANRHAGQ